MVNGEGGLKAIVFLVHGTFAKDAEWTREEVSCLCKHLKTSLASDDIDVEFVRVPWSGRNRLADRQIGADSLIELYGQQCQKTPEATYFAIGHSHGGSVIAYAIQRHDGVKQAFRVAFLATPFIDLKIRESLGATIAVPITLSGYAAFIWALATNWAWLAQVATDLGAALSWQLGEPGAHLVGALGLGVLLFAVGSCLHRAGSRWATSACAKYSKKYATTNFESNSHVFVRCVGDEAAATLAAGQFANWAIGKITDWFIFTARKLDAIVWFWRQLVSGHPVIFCFALVGGGVLTLMAMLGIANHTKEELKFLGENFAQAFDSLMSLARSVENYVLRDGENASSFKPSEIGLLLRLLAMGIFLEFVVIFAVSFVVYGLVLSLMAITVLPLVFVSALYGRAAVWRNFFLDIAVEPTPIGDVVLKTIDWDEVDAARLNHSATYDNPHVHKYLCSWIASQTEAAPLLPAQDTVSL